MPQNDTTIYWDGYGPTPPIIDTLPDEARSVILKSIAEKKDQLSYSDPSGTYFIFIFMVVAISIIAFKSRKNNNSGPAPEEVSEIATDANPAEPSLRYDGASLNFADEEYEHMLSKHLPYYGMLDDPGKLKFKDRLKQFIASKTFIIHDESGFKEMPVLISAVSIQLTFGLNKFLLPYFDFINIYPQEFLGTVPFVRFLEGNVSGNTINISWKHFLADVDTHIDGQNVGLHEMAHALYYQTFVIEENIDRGFKHSFEMFNTVGNKVYEKEKAFKPGLYSEYAMKDFQEFWAESIEIFFEKPLAMKTAYPDLFESLVSILNQDPSGISISA